MEVIDACRQMSDKLFGLFYFWTTRTGLNLPCDITTTTD